MVIRSGMVLLLATSYILLTYYPQSVYSSLQSFQGHAKGIMGDSARLSTTDKIGVDGLAELRGRDFRTGIGNRSISSVVAGYYFSCALRSDGSLVCWGDNLWGQLGIESTAIVGLSAGDMGINLQPVDLGTGKTALSLATGFDHICAIRSDYSVVCWGRNVFGGLGIGSTSIVGATVGDMGNNLTEVDLGSGSAVRVSKLVAGAYFTCALRSDGSVVCWGHNNHGQLGIESTSNIGDEDGEMGSNLQPVSLGRGQTAVAIVAGGYHTCAVRHDGSIVCWGANSDGQLGIGSTTDVGTGPQQMGDFLQPVDLGEGNSVLALTAGQEFTCALRTDGFVVCWGNNFYGQLGIGHTNDVGSSSGQMGDNLTTVDLGSGRTAVSVAAGNVHVCALRDDGSVVCWGFNENGELGTGSTQNWGTAPGQMGDNLIAVNLGQGNTAAALVAGDWHTCALRSDGSLGCWGTNDHGQLGIGNNVEIGSSAGYIMLATDVGAGNCTTGYHYIFSFREYSSSGNGSCIACGTGTYLPSPGSSVCTRCSAGSFSSAPAAAGGANSSGCTLCQAGTYQSGVGMSACTACPAGTWAPAAGAAGAADCAAGCALNTTVEALLTERDDAVTGGLGTLATRGVYTWWCLPMECVPPQDLACFKYSSSAQAFHFWGRNSELHLVRP